ncbi:nucleoid-associated protein YgaU [Paraburkholderia sp. RAU2J]|uniref:CIS tube protein n=1 Tax=Paraburkholderia sp. RAU2J TaxID=1938810 RepID=UPI000EB05F78|nr:LysM peptidoglycan-binding domain-containing protein [Paraburkholderia sp. RAU2J]RKT13296.1 nucleoid-associated protein YgaU [Paraburkholderia sp. RAU2J]
MAKLEKAKITVLDGANKGQVYEVLFNPTEYSFDRTNAFKSTPIPGLISPLIQFVNGEADTLSMELFLDDYTDRPGGASGTAPKSVEDRVKDLSGLLNIDRSLHAPPPVRFSWGPLEFTGIIDKMGRKVSLFQPDGTPARVRLSVSFKEYRTIDQQLQSPRRESSDKSKRRVIVGQDSLWAMAAREYGDPAQWRFIATQNDLDDPREVRPAQWLILPPLEVDSGPL